MKSHKILAIAIYDTQIQYYDEVGFIAQNITRAIMEDGKILEEKELIHQIKDFIKTNKLKIKDPIFYLNSRVLNSHTLYIPNVAEDKINDMIRYEMENEIEDFTKNFTYDFLKDQNGEKQGLTTMMVYYIESAIVEQYSTLFKNLRIKPKVITSQELWESHIEIDFISKPQKKSGIVLKSILGIVIISMVMGQLYQKNCEELEVLNREIGQQEVLLQKIPEQKEMEELQQLQEEMIELKNKILEVQSIKEKINHMASLYRLLEYIEQVAPEHVQLQELQLIDNLIMIQGTGASIEEVTNFQKKILSFHDKNRVEVSSIQEQNHNSYGFVLNIQVIGGEKDAAK